MKFRPGARPLLQFSYLFARKPERDVSGNASKVVNTTLLFVPLAALIEADTVPSKNVQCASYRQIHFPSTELLDQFKVFEMSSASGVRYWFGAPFSKSYD